MNDLLHLSNHLKVYCGDVLDTLKMIQPRKFQTCITSPPYWGLRDYKTGTWEGGDSECDHRRKNVRPDHSGRTIKGRGHQGSAVSSATPYKETCGICGAKRIDRQIGLEPTIEEYVEKMVEVFREVRRVLRDDGVLFLNLGDSYVGGPRRDEGFNERWHGKHYLSDKQGETARTRPERKQPINLKPKNLIGMPWRVALALQEDGWWLRSDIIWSKNNPMPSSVTDRPTCSHEYLFMLSKKAKYFYDGDAIREPSVDPHRIRSDQVGGNKGIEVHHSPGGIYTQNPQGRAGISKDDYDERKWADRSDGLSRPPMTMKDREYNPLGRNKRTVWTIPTQPFPGSHFAVFPEKLVEPCVLAGTSAKGCCPGCSAPWRRTVARTFRPQADVSPEKGVRGHTGQKPMDESNTWAGTPRGTTESQTTGWEPTCRCPVLEAYDQGIREIKPIECWILDPFCGTATVGVVALAHGRKFCGIDLSEEYLKTMAIPRLKAAEAKPIPQELF